jgi:outer membrane protein, multidrug efflux system
MLKGAVGAERRQTCMRGTRRARWIVATTLLVVGACSLGPHYTRPVIPAPLAWRSSATSAEWPLADWMQGFNSPQLEVLIAEAQEANDDISAAVARVREADAVARIAGAELLPSASAGGGANRARQTSRNLAPISYDTFTTTLSASYEIDFWGKNRAKKNAAVLTAAASRYDRDTVELSVLTSVAITYFQVLVLHDRLNVAQDNLTRAQSVLNGLNLEQKVGTVTALDVAQQATVVATLEAAVPPLKQQLLQTIDALAILVGKEPQSMALGEGKLAELTEPQIAPGLPSELLRRRPDVASAEAQLQAANANIAAARAAFFPSIVLTANGGYESTELATLFSPAARVFALSAGVTQPIFQGGALLGQYRYSAARYAELLASYHKAVISAFSNVEDALIAVQQSAEEEHRQQEAVNAARNGYELSQAQWHAGIINILTVLNTESALFTSEDALVQAKYSHLQALIALFNALGGGWQKA